MLWAPLTNRLSANNALQDSDKTAQVVFSIFPSLAVNGAELSPPFQTQVTVTKMLLLWPITGARNYLTTLKDSKCQTNNPSHHLPQGAADQKTLVWQVMIIKS